MPWSSLESSTSAVPAVWRRRIGAQFEVFRTAFLQSRPEPARFFPCQKCGCAHEVIVHAPEDIVAVCACEPWNCADLKLTPADIQILELNWPKLARALCKALGLAARSVDFTAPNTRQIGSWSADGVAVILTIQRDKRDFWAAVAELTARLRQKFILLAPTSDNFDAACQDLLAHAGAGFFALDSLVLLTEHGALQPRRPPGELFRPLPA